jgi:Spy/CpxP family protein refolding chaperone
MLRKLFLIAAICAMFIPQAFSDSQIGGGTGGEMRDGAGNSRRAEGEQRPNGAKQEKAPPNADQAADNVGYILGLQDKLKLTQQQLIQIHMIQADSQEEAPKRALAVRDCRQEYAKSLNQLKPDFAAIRVSLNDLKESLANEEAVPLEIYEKAYNLLTDKQKEILAFFKAMQRAEKEKPADVSGAGTGGRSQAVR